MSEGLAVAEGFVRTQGVRLHYIDWGGTGPALVFLAGFGNTPHVFDSVAKRLTDRVHVLGLTRRAHGQSDQPETGYDVPTLALDVVGFLDHLGIERASFAGHSFAGCEMVCLGAAHGGRVEKLVFLDALYGLEEEDLRLFASNPLRAKSAPPESFESVEAYSEDFVTRYSQYRRLRSPMWDALMSYGLVRTPDGRFRERLRPAAAEQLGMGQLRFRAEWREVRCPVLAVYASQDETWSLPEDASPELRDAAAAYARRLDRDRRQRYIDRARREMPDIRVLELPNTSHYCFLDREDAVAEAMRRFL